MYQQEFSMYLCTNWLCGSQRGKWHHLDPYRTHTQTPFPGKSGGTEQAKFNPIAVCITVMQTCISVETSDKW